MCRMSEDVARVFLSLGELTNNRWGVPMAMKDKLLQIEWVGPCVCEGTCDAQLGNLCVVSLVWHWFTLCLGSRNHNFT